MSTPTPSKPEDEYFSKIEAEKKKKLSEEIKQALDAEERKKLKEAHWMHCPKCGMDLHAVVFRGVTVDKCFGCQGVFLDDGELEKIAGEESGFLPGLMSLFRF